MRFRLKRDFIIDRCSCSNPFVHLGKLKWKSCHGIIIACGSEIIYEAFHVTKLSVDLIWDPSMPFRKSLQ